MDFQTGSYSFYVRVAGWEHTVAFLYPKLQSSTVSKQIVLLWTYPRKVSSSLTLHHNAPVVHLTSSQTFYHLLSQEEEEEEG